MKAQRFIKKTRGQAVAENAWLLALFLAVLLAILGPMRKSLQGFFLGKGNEMSTLKIDETSTGKIKTKNDSVYHEKSFTGNVKQTYTQNDNSDDTSVTTNR